MKKLLIIVSSLIVAFTTALAGCGGAKVKLGNVLILGDSYSTFEGYTYNDYPSWYSTYANTAHSDVFAVEDTWWWQVVEGTDAELKINSSYSGSFISNATNKTNSFLTRFYALTANGVLDETQIDTVFVFGGLNDYWNDVRSGQLQFEGWTDYDLQAIIPAFCCLLNDINTALPDARVIVVMDETLPYNMRLLFNYVCSYYEMESITPTGISKQNSHPNKAGMKSISSQILDYLKETEKENK